MKRSSDPEFRFDYRIEVTREMLRVLFFTPYENEGPSKSFLFRQVTGSDFRLIEGNRSINTIFSPGYIYPFSSIKNLCDQWLEGVI